jgi:nitrous oxidase accessory protein
VTARRARATRFLLSGIGIMLAILWLFFHPLDAFALADAEAEPGAALQERIDQAESGGTVVIPSGTYAGPIVISKPLVLKAKNGGKVTLINTSGKPAVTISADDVAVADITIVDKTAKEEPAVLIKGNRVLLDSLHIVTSSHGVMMRDAHDGEVKDSVIEWGREGITSFSEKGNGIDLYNAHRVRLLGNTIKRVHDGIYLENSDDTVISRNRIERSRYGVHCMYTKGTVIRDNTGTMNITGAMIMAVQNVELSGNTFTKQSENVNSQGILLYDAHETRVDGNAVTGNRVGLYIEQSANNLVENNALAHNFIGIQLIESTQNTIAGNRFVGNVTDALALGSADNKLAGNYWDAFSGIDADGDGRSDIRYQINPFFQGLIEKRPAFQIFFQTPGIAFLEGLYEANAGEWTSDEAPLMKPPAALRQEDWSQSGVLSGATGVLLAAAASVIIFISRRKSG